jgi:peptide/nickel transport system permease protein
MKRVTGWVGATIVALALCVAIIAPLLTRADPFTQDLAHRLLPPAWMASGSAAHPLGTDHLGRDDLARLIYGTRISILIGLWTVLTSGVIGVVLGLAGGFFGGWVDEVVMFAISCRLAIPLVLVALSIVATFGSSLGVVVMCLGLLLWDRFAVVARRLTLQFRRQDFIAAAWAAGCSRTHILVREILPNILPGLVVVATLEAALAMLLEATLSFLGLGIPPPLPSWGLMIAEGRNDMFVNPWVIAIPGAALFVVVFGMNLLADGLPELMGEWVERRSRYR